MTQDIVAPIESEIWFKALIDDCKDIIVESSFASRWALIEGYHQLGERIISDEQRLKQGGGSLRETLQQVARSLGKSERTIYYAVEFTRKFPDLDKLPEGKNTLWRDIVHKYLPTSKKNKVDVSLPEETEKSEDRYKDALVEIGDRVDNSVISLVPEIALKEYVVMREDISKIVQEALKG